MTPYNQYEIFISNYLISDETVFEGECTTEADSCTYPNGKCVSGACGCEEGLTYNAVQNACCKLVSWETICFVCDMSELHIQTKFDLANAIASMRQTITVPLSLLFLIYSKRLLSVRLCFFSYLIE